MGISDGKGVAKAGIEASSRELAAGRKCRSGVDALTALCVGLTSREVHTVAFIM